MGAANIREINERLMECGLSGSTPVLAVNNGTTPRERHLQCDLASIADEAERADFTGPLLFIIGRVVSLYNEAVARPPVLESLGLQLASGYAHA